MATTIVAGGTELLNPRGILRDQLHVQPGQVIGALGCGGAGFFALEAARLVGDQGQVYAVDIIKNALTSVGGKAKLQGLYNLKTVWSDLEIFRATEIPDGTLDHGMLVNMLFQSKKHQAILKEAGRLMKPAGKLLVIDWNDVTVPFGPRKEDRVNIESLRTLIPSLGFTEDKFFEAGQYHFGLIYTRV